MHTLEYALAEVTKSTYVPAEVSPLFIDYCLLQIETVEASPLAYAPIKESPLDCIHTEVHF